MPKQRFAEASWCAEDLEDYQLKGKEAEGWLEQNEYEIQEAMIAAGWKVIENLMKHDAIPKIDAQKSSEDS